MGDMRRDGYGRPEEDRLPWLEPVDEVRGDEGVPAGRLLAGLLVALLALGLVVGGVYWLKQRAIGPQIATTAGDTVKAPAGPYKVRPAEPGGMQVNGQGDASYAASEGADVNGQIDLAAAPEAPVTKAKPVAAPAPTPPAASAAPAPKPAAAPVVAPVAVAAAAPKGGAQVQLGAFASEAKANTAWKSLSGRFSTLAGLTPSVVAAEVNGKTVYRLRAVAGTKASEICAKLKVAGDTCLVVG